MTTNRLLVSGWLVAENRDTPYDGSTRTENPLGERTEIRVWLLTADVRVTARSGVQVTATLPDVTRSAVVTRADGSRADFRERFRGPGDTSVIVWHRLPVRRGWNVTLNGGLSLPTGRTEAPRFRDALSDGSLVPISRLQRGTGTFDPILGASANRVVVRILPPGVRVFASAAARIPLAENTHGLRTGASWEFGVGGSRELRQAGLGHNVIGILRAGWLHRERDTFDGTPVLVGGGDWITIAPALAAAFGTWTVQAEVKLPAWRSLSNRQLDSARVLQVGVVKAF
ncbi:MAG: hypothetical protein M3Q55_01535 [Acidobacteriota bacterium]|nr:hypothetical protein [Acidobacteriota bacterium]